MKSIRPISSLLLLTTLALPIASAATQKSTPTSAQMRSIAAMITDKNVPAAKRQLIYGDKGELLAHEAVFIAKEIRFTAYKVMENGSIVVYVRKNGTSGPDGLRVISDIGLDGKVDFYTAVDGPVDRKFLFKKAINHSQMSPRTKNNQVILDFIADQLTEYKNTHKIS